jgi:hypothetical protein
MHISRPQVANLFWNDGQPGEVTIYSRCKMNLLQLTRLLLNWSPALGSSATLYNHAVQYAHAFCWCPSRFTNRLKIPSILAVRHFSIHCFGSVSHKKHLMKSVTFVGNASSMRQWPQTTHFRAPIRTGKRFKMQKKQPHALRSPAKNYEFLNTF